MLRDHPRLAHARLEQPGAWLRDKIGNAADFTAMAEQRKAQAEDEEGGDRSRLALQSGEVA